MKVKKKDVTRGVQMKRFLLNIAQHKIHNGFSPCPPAKRMAECNKKWFDTYLEAENYYEGGIKKGEICTLCFKNKNDAIRYGTQILSR